MLYIKVDLFTIILFLLLKNNHYFIKKITTSSELMHTDNNETPLKKNNIQEVDLGDELILSEPHTNNIHILNNTTKIIWFLSDGSNSLQDIEDELKKRFSDTNDHNIRMEIKQAVSELRGKGLLQ